MIVDDDVLEAGDDLATRRDMRHGHVHRPNDEETHSGIETPAVPECGQQYAESMRYEPLPYGRVMISSRCPSGSGK